MRIVSKRIAKEIRGIREDPSLIGQISIDLVDESEMRQLRGKITGPPDTPYAGGTFTIGISLPEGYPFEAPSVRFETKIWHPNISSASGYICLDILTSNWSASQTILTILLSIQSLMQDPVPDDPQDAVVAKQMKRSPKRFRDTARFWTITYAMGDNGEKEKTVIPDDLREYDRKVTTVMAVKGLGRDQALVFCSNKNWIIKYKMPVDVDGTTTGVMTRAAQRRAAAAGARRAAATAAGKGISSPDRRAVAAVSDVTTAATTGSVYQDAPMETEDEKEE